MHLVWKIQKIFKVIISAILDWIYFKVIQSLQCTIIYSLQLLRSSRSLLRSSRSLLRSSRSLLRSSRSNLEVFNPVYNWSLVYKLQSKPVYKTVTVRLNRFLPSIDLTVTIFSNIIACKSLVGIPQFLLMIWLDLKSFFGKWGLDVHPGRHDSINT